MKYILTALIWAMAFFSACSQIPKGTRILGASLGGVYARDVRNGSTFDQTHSFSFQASYGWFVIKNLSAGLTLDAYTGRTNPKSTFMDDMQANTTTRTAGAGLFVSDYIPVKGRFYAVVAVAYALQWGRKENEGIDIVDQPTLRASAPGNDRNHDVRTNTFGLRAGAAYVIRRRHAVETTLGYARRNDRIYGTTGTPQGLLTIDIGYRRFLFRQNG
jgi:hypothetical protein